MWAPAAAAAAFNLLCTGTETMPTPGGDRTAPYERVYRVDLAAGRWCVAQCKDTHALFEVSNTRLTFEKSRERTGSLSFETVDFVDRETGEHHMTYAITGVGDGAPNRYTGQCQRRPFTGFPAIRTKF